MKKRIAVLTGAGVSAESGLGTYRDNGGLWDNYDPMVVASAEGWAQNPGLVLDSTTCSAKSCAWWNRTRRTS